MNYSYSHMAMQQARILDAAELSRHLDAAPDMVFSAFADPGLVRRWLRPNPEVRLDVLAFDFRIGGAYRFAYHVPDGAIMRVNGVFRAIERPSQIVFSWNIEPPDEHAGLQSEVQISITADGDGSHLNVRHIKLTQAGTPQRHAEGWRGAAELLSVLLQENGNGRSGTSLLIRPLSTRASAGSWLKLPRTAAEPLPPEQKTIAKKGKKR